MPNTYGGNLKLSNDDKIMIFNKTDWDWWWKKKKIIPNEDFRSLSLANGNKMMMKKKWKNCIMIKVDEKSLFVVWLSIEERREVESEMSVCVRGV